VNGESCKRKRINIGGENFYLVVGKRFIDATVPHENRPENQDLRKTMDAVCAEATELLELLNQGATTNE
jgi:hypothetical protein